MSEHIEYQTRYGETIEGFPFAVRMGYLPGCDEPVLAAGRYGSADGGGTFRLTAPIDWGDLPWVVAQGVWED